MIPPSPHRDKGYGGMTPEPVIRLGARIFAANISGMFVGNFVGL
jgi:hypothetical protein